MRKIESYFIGSPARLALALHRHPGELAAARHQHHRAGDQTLVDVLRGRLFDLLSCSEESPTSSGLAVVRTLSACAANPKPSNDSTTSVRLKPFMSVSPVRCGNHSAFEQRPLALESSITASMTARTRGSARRSRWTSSHWSANTSVSDAAHAATPNRDRPDSRAARRGRRRRAPPRAAPASCCLARGRRRPAAHAASAGPACSYGRRRSRSTGRPSIGTPSCPSAKSRAA